MSYSDAKRKKIEKIIMSSIFLPLITWRSLKALQVIVYKVIICKVIMCR